MFRIVALAATIGVLSAPIAAMEFDLVDRCAPKFPSARSRPRTTRSFPRSPDARETHDVFSPAPDSQEQRRG